MKDNFQWKTILPKYQKIFNDITCPALTLVPTPAINCCNNVLNCEYTECINIVQTCKQTISGETEISNATQCQRSECPMNRQLCLAGTPGAGPFNWICQNNKWVKKQPTPTPPTTPTAPVTAPTAPTAPVTAPTAPTPPAAPTAPTPPAAPTAPTAPTPPAAPTPPTAPTAPTSVPTSSVQSPKTTTNYTMFIIVFVVVIILCAFSFFVASK